MAADFSCPLRLMRRQDGELDPEPVENLERFHVHCGFWQPHSFRRAAKSILEIPNSPSYLGVLIPSIGQGQNNVMVGLGQGRTVAGKSRATGVISLEDRPIYSGGVSLHPAKQGGTEIEADSLVVVENPNDPTVS